MFKQMTVRDLDNRLKAGESIYLLDVRHLWEHQKAAIPNSTLVPLQQLGTRVSEVQPPEGSTVVVYCHHGVRSQNAAAFLVHQGFKEVYSLVGGIDAWSREIDPTVPQY